jgi:hypothetical protein
MNGHTPTDPCVPPLNVMLAEAQLALHRLQIGERAQRVTLESGRTVEFTPADIDKLTAYVTQLQMQIAGTYRRGAIGVIF